MFKTSSFPVNKIARKQWWLERTRPSKKISNLFEIITIFEIIWTVMEVIEATVSGVSVFLQLKHQLCVNGIFILFPSLPPPNPIPVQNIFHGKSEKYTPWKLLWKILFYQEVGQKLTKIVSLIHIFSSFVIRSSFAKVSSVIFYVDAKSGNVCN